MKMILIDELRVCRVAPWLGVEVKANDNVGTNGFIDPLRAATDFRHAIKKPLALLAKALFVSGRALVGEGGDRRILELGWTQRSRRGRFFARQEDLGTEAFQARGQNLRHGKSHVPLRHGR